MGSPDFRDSFLYAAEQLNADLVAFGRPFISNPDLVERFAHGWPLNPPARMKDWYAYTKEGYIDFPIYEAEKVSR
jgi:N-ethylmaleimide reductase